ncbi:MAG: hypothetical protein ACI90V_003267 [Bacillariaceae sp.]|jgi:hypothetical protein
MNYQMNAYTFICYNIFNLLYYYYIIHSSSSPIDVCISDEREYTKT